MWNLNKVTLISYRGGYVFGIRFDDGLEANADLVGVRRTGAGL